MKTASRSRSGCPVSFALGEHELSPGYLNRPELTEEHFIPNPFATASDRARGHTWMYKTGDVCRLSSEWGTPILWAAMTPKCNSVAIGLSSLRLLEP